jgi:hypothetical protein
MSIAKKILTAGPYWIGVAMTLACFALVLTRNTGLIWRFEHSGFPLSWKAGAAAVAAFLAAELSYSVFSVPREVDNPIAQLAPELEAAEF